MRAEIISVGTELLLGNVVNTDAADISRMLSELGIDVFHHTVVGDNRERAKAAVEIAKSRADLIITTGGLGPTCDDLTKEILCSAFGKKLVYNEEAAEVMRRYFADRLPGHQVPENNYSQAYLPEGCVPFQNTCGTAPGCAFEAEGKRVIMLPGPPRECRTMFRRSVMPYLASNSEDRLFSRFIRVFGVGESRIDELLRPLMDRLENPTLAPYAGNAECMLRLTAKAKSEAEAEALAEPVLSEVRKALGEYIYTEAFSSLEETAVSLLSGAGLTLAVSEEYTGGLLSKRITDVPGAESVFLGSAVLPAAGANASEAAKKARALFGSKLAVAVCGFSGDVSIALAAPDGVFEKSVSLGSDRVRARHAAASHALDMIRRYIMGLPV